MIIIAIPRLTLAGWQGFPLEDNTNVHTWYLAQESYQPMGQLYSAIVERCNITGVSLPSIVQTWTVDAGFGQTNWTNNGTVYTNIFMNVTNVTTTNHFGPFTYSYSNQYANGSGTGFPVVTHALIDALDTKIETLVPYFIVTNLADSAGSFSNYLNRVGTPTPSTWNNHPGSVPVETWAGLFARNDIGVSTNLTTNDWGLVNGGSAYFTHSATTTNIVLAEMHASAKTNVYVMTGFGDANANGRYEDLGEEYFGSTAYRNGNGYRLWDFLGFSYTLDEPSEDASARYTSSNLQSSNWTASAGSAPGGTSTLSQASSKWRYVYCGSLIDDALGSDKSVEYLQQDNYPYLIFEAGGTNTQTSKTIDLRGYALTTNVPSTTIYTHETVTATTHSTKLSKQWVTVEIDLRNATPDNTNDLFYVAWSNIIMYGDSPYMIRAADLDERYKVINALRWTLATDSIVNNDEYYEGDGLDSNTWANAQAGSSNNWQKTVASDYPGKWTAGIYQPAPDNIYDAFMHASDGGVQAVAVTNLQHDVEFYVFARPAGTRATPGDDVDDKFDDYGFTGLRSNNWCVFTYAIDSTFFTNVSDALGDTNQPVVWCDAPDATMTNRTLGYYVDKDGIDSQAVLKWEDALEYK